MLKLNDGRSELWQWDTGRKLTVDADCSQIHFSNKIFGRSIDVDVVDGVAIIPDVLLQTDNDLNAWAFVGTAENGYTKIAKEFKINKRNKPSDYVYTPVEQVTLKEVIDRLEELEKGGGESGADGKDGATFIPSVSSDGVISWTNDGGKQNPDPVNIKGPQGPQGPQGDDYTLTEADKQEIAEMTAELIEGGGDVGGYEQFNARYLTGGNFTRKEGYYAYRDNRTNFTYTMPYPQKGEVKVTIRQIRDEGQEQYKIYFYLVYSDGTMDRYYKENGETKEVVSNADKTLVKITGDWAEERWAYIDLSVMSVVSDYPVPEIMYGATVSMDGEYGFVPTPKAGDQYKVLFGSGKWGEIQGGGSNGLLDGCELIACGTTSADGSIIISADKNGNTFSLTKLVFFMYGSFTSTTSFTSVGAQMESNSWFAAEVQTPSTTTGLVAIMQVGNPMIIKMLRADGLGNAWGYGVQEELFHTRLTDIDGSISISVPTSNFVKFNIAAYLGNSNPKAGTLYALYGVRA